MSQRWSSRPWRLRWEATNREELEIRGHPWPQCDHSLLFLSTAASAERGRRRVYDEYTVRILLKMQIKSQGGTFVVCKSKLLRPQPLPSSLVGSIYLFEHTRGPAYMHCGKLGERYLFGISGSLGQVLAPFFRRKFIQVPAEASSIVRVKKIIISPCHDDDTEIAHGTWCDAREMQPRCASRAS